jgi:hypothetical protein
VDYSNRFGFGYQLSDKSVGLLFNDSTRIGCTKDRYKQPELEFLKSLWGLGTEEE